MRPGIRVRFEVIVAALAFALVMVQLTTPSYIGMADNGDFGRIMYPFGLDYTTADPAARYFGYVNQFMTFVAPGHVLYPSSTLGIVWLAVAINQTLHAGTFDVGVVGVIYALLFAAAVYLLVRGLRRLVPSFSVVAITCLVGAFVLLDVAYIAYFNSLYSEPTTYVFLLLALGAALNLIAAERPNYALLGVYAISAALFIAAKNQNLPATLLLAAFSARLIWVYRDRFWRASTVGSALALVAVAGYMYLSTPSNFEQINTYDGVFMGAIYNESPADAARDLTDLGVDPSYAYLAGQPYFAPASTQALQQPAFAYDFYHHVSRTKVVEFYLSHPWRFVEGMQESAVAADTMRPDYLGNLLRVEGLPARTKSDRLSLWSSLKATLFPQSVWALVVFYLGYFAAIIWKRRRARSAREKLLADFCAVVGLMACIVFPVAFVGEGTFELVKHQFTFDLLFDLTLLIALTAVVAQLVRPSREELALARGARPRLELAGLEGVELGGEAAASGAPGASLGTSVEDEPENALLREHMRRWWLFAAARVAYRRWTRIAVRAFPAGSRRAAFVRRLGVPLPDRLNMSWITPNLAVGGRLAVADIPLVAAAGVTCIVDTRAEEHDDEAALGAAGIKLLCLPAPDAFPLSVEQLRYGAAWINNRIDWGERVLVHCEHGVGRSVMLVAAALMARGLSVEVAVRLIQQRRWQAAPNREQVLRLQQYERSLRAAPVGSSSDR